MFMKARHGHLTSIDDVSCITVNTYADMFSVGTCAAAEKLDTHRHILLCNGVGSATVCDSQPGSHSRHILVTQAESLQHRRSGRLLC